MGTPDNQEDRGTLCDIPPNPGGFAPLNPPYFSELSRPEKHNKFNAGRGKPSPRWFERLPKGE